MFWYRNKYLDLEGFNWQWQWFTGDNTCLWKDYTPEISLAISKKLNQFIWVEDDNFVCQIDGSYSVDVKFMFQFQTMDVSRQRAIRRKPEPEPFLKSVPSGELRWLSRAWKEKILSQEEKVRPP